MYYYHCHNLPDRLYHEQLVGGLGKAFCDFTTHESGWVGNGISTLAHRQLHYTGATRDMASKRMSVLTDTFYYFTVLDDFVFFLWQITALASHWPHNIYTLRKTRRIFRR